MDKYDTAKFENVGHNLNFQMASWPPPVFKYDKSKFKKANALHSVTKSKFEGARHFPKKGNYDRSKFEKVPGSIYFVKDLDMRPQEKFDLKDLKCQNRNRNGLCVSYVVNEQNIATMPPVKNNNGDFLRAPVIYDYEERNDSDYNIGSESLEDLTRIGRIQDRAHGNVSEDYVDVSNKLLVREQIDVKPEFKLDQEQQKQLLIELENALRKPPVITARKSLSHKKRKKRKGLRTPKKTDLNITFTPLKYYRAVTSDELDSDEDDSDSDEKNESVTITIVKTGTIKIVEASEEHVKVKKSPILKKEKKNKNKRNRFSVIDNEKNKATHKKKFKAKNNSNQNKDSGSAESGEKKNDSYKYKSDESYGSAEKLSIEIHAQSGEYTTLRPKKKKKRKSTVYMYMQGPQRQYTDSEEGSRRSVIALRHQTYNDKYEATTKKRVSEDYIDYENYRRTIPMFLPKRYFWKKNQLLDLGYFWFNGPQGHTPGPYQINY